MTNSYTFSETLFLWNGDSAWYFLPLPQEIYQEIKDGVIFKNGFGSIKVEVTIGSSRWKTSIFPDTKHGRYMLPVKKQVREKENIKAGDIVKATVTLLDVQ